jgi:hypothetical protein
LREVGVRILERIALDPAVGRDLRARRELQEAREKMGRVTPSKIAGLVRIFDEWWTDRGDDPRLTHDSTRIPEVGDWLDRLETERGPEAWSGLRMLADLDDHPLRRRLLLEQLSPERHAHLVAECAQTQLLDALAVQEQGIARPQWDPESGRMIGHHAYELRAHARDILGRVTDHIPSGAGEGAIRNDWAFWWERARFEARYWRDPLDAPTFDRWFEKVDRPVAEGGPTVGGWVRELYVSVGARARVLEQLGVEQASLTAELMELLQEDRDGAIESGLNLSYFREPLVPRRDYEGQWVAIPWTRAQELILDVLDRITGIPSPADSRTQLVAALAFRRDWWASASRDPVWYRDDSQAVEVDSRGFEMERARIR